MTATLANANLVHSAFCAGLLGLVCMNVGVLEMYFLVSVTKKKPKRTLSSCKLVGCQAKSSARQNKRGQCNL